MASCWNVCRGCSASKAPLSVPRLPASGLWSSLWDAWIKLTFYIHRPNSQPHSQSTFNTQDKRTHVHKSMRQWVTEATSTQLPPLQRSNLRSSSWTVVKKKKHTTFTFRCESTPWFYWSKRIFFSYLFIIECLVCSQHVLDTREKKTTPILVKLTFFLIHIKLLRIRTSSYCLTLMGILWVMNEYPLT